MSGLESEHVTFPLASRLMRNFSTVVSVPVGVVDSTGQDRSCGWSVAAKLVGDQSSRFFLLAFQDLAQKALGGVCITTLLHQDVEYVAILVNGPQFDLNSDGGVDFQDVGLFKNLFGGRPGSRQW